MRKKKQKFDKKLWRAFGWAVVITTAIILLTLAFSFRGALTEGQKDPLLTEITTGSAFEIASTLHRIQNHFALKNIENCWNMKNTDSCGPNNELTEGNYAFKSWTAPEPFVGPNQDDLHLSIASSREAYIMPHELVEKLTNQAASADKEYYQILRVSYPQEDVMKITIETFNIRGDKEEETIALTP